jgi:hypothetical protein
MCVEGGALTEPKHPMQKGMQVRINLLLANIEEAGPSGVDQKDLELLFFMNGFGTPSLVKRYLSLLSDFGKVRKEGTKYFSRNFPERGDARQQRIDEAIEPGSIHTHTHNEP